MTPTSWSFARTLEFGFHIHHVWHEYLWQNFPWIIFPSFGYLVFGVIVYFLD